MPIPANFDYNLIKTLVLVFETKSMRKAAQTLGISAPTLTYSLNKIRDYYNDPLFIKTAHGFKTTSVAKQLYPVFKKIDEEIRHTVVGDNRDTNTFRSIIIRTNTLIEFFLTGKLFKVAGEGAGLNFEFNNKILTDEQRIGTLISREADIDIGPAIRSNSSLICTHLFKSKLIVLCSTHHPRIGTEITQEQWLREEHAIVSVMEGVSYWPVAVNELLGKRKIRYRTTSLLNIFHCLEVSEIIMVIPEYFTQNIMDKFALRCVEMPWLNEDLLDIYAYVHSRAKDDERLKMIVDLLKEN